MYFIDRIFSVAAQPEMQMADKSVVYQSVSFFDRYFDSTAKKYHEIKAQPLPRDDFRTIGMRDVRTFDDFMKLDAFRLKPEEIFQLRQGTFNDLIAAGYTGFFLASKNTEVQPISLNDMTRVLLADERIGTEEILTKEHAMRKSINYENEVATMFEFIMFFAKSWKIAC